MKARPVVATYYFPNWHCDPHIEELHGKGWTEWRVLQHATPRFPGHRQPKVPLWGYQDEADPGVMAQKIAAAREYGIDAFIFDWYSFNDFRYRDRCLNEGFLKAANCQEIKFALMWCNHNPVYAHPGTYWKPAEVNWQGDNISVETFRRETEDYIEKYFSLPNYLRVDGGLYFCIFNPRKLIEHLGGEEITKALIAEFRSKVRAAGLGEVNLNARCDIFDRTGTANVYTDYEKMVKSVGFDSISEHAWKAVGETFPAIEAAEWITNNHAIRKVKCNEFKGIYYPSVATGWDTSPRTVQSDMYERRGYPFTPIIVNYTPELFEADLKLWKKEYEAGSITGGMIPIACWNEWTEGACLEPDADYGYGFLEAVRNVFGKGE